MSDYKELVEELRSTHIEDRYKRLTLDAADAIERLCERPSMSDHTELVKALRCIDMMGSCPCDYSNLCQNFECITDQAADAIEALQAEVDEAKQHNTGLLNMKEMTEDEMLEYIRTTPVGPLEPMLIEQLHKQGKWVEDTTTHASPGLSNYKCSLCGKICGTWRRGLKPRELPNWCGNCGADMRKMEMQK